jgi:hypothetical protein
LTNDNFLIIFNKTKYGVKMKSISKRNIFILTYSFFNILFGIFIGIMGLSVVLFIYDLFIPGHLYSGFYSLLSILGISIPSLINSRIGVTMFTTSVNYLEILYFIFFYTFIFCAAVLYSLIKIKFIIKSALVDTPFRADVCKSVKKIGLVIILTPLTLILVESFLLFVLLDVRIANKDLSFFLFKAFINWFYYGVVGVLFLAIGNVFETGSQLKQENDLTV